MNAPASTLDRLAARAEQLYSLPAVAMEVLDLTRDPQVDTRAIKECIENDPAMAGRILRVVNSSLFGLSREVSDLNQALTLLGIKPLKLLVLGFSLPSGLFLDIEARTLAWYWRHTLTKAVAARELSQQLWRIPGDEAFLAGLFQDLGILLLLQELGNPYARFLDRGISGHLDISAIEQKAMGFDHVALSVKLLTQWKLPEALIEAVAWRPHAGADAAGDAESSQPPALAKILHLAELIAQLLADGQTQALGGVLAVGRSYHRLLESQLDSLVADMEEKTRQLATILSLQLPGGLEYRDILAQAHRQLARVASWAAEEMLNPGQQDSPETEEESLLGEIQTLNDAISAIGRRHEEPHAAAPMPTTTATATTATATRTATKTVIDASLMDRLARFATACRQSRRPLSLLLAELGCSDQQIEAMSSNQFGSFLRLLEAKCRDVDHPCATCVPYGKAGFALILPGCERRRAIELGNQLVRAVCQSDPPHDNKLARMLNLGVGLASVALPPKNFPPQSLLDGADRCLYGSHTSGGGVIKSIEIY